jgi:DNA polymerase-3 subunit alpha
MPDVSHLHCHTQYSLLDGAAGIDNLIESAERRDIPAVAITDHGNLYGVPEFYTTAKDSDVQPIIGCEFYLTPSGIDDKTDKTRYHQVLLAKNQTGYENLMKLSSLSFTEGFYYKPRIDRDLLREYHEGLVATTCCLQGHVPQTILNENEERAREVFEEYLDIFGDDYYIELQDHDIDDQHTVNEVLLQWRKEYDVKLLATNDVHYVDRQDHEAQDILLCLQTGADYKDPDRMRFSNDQFYLKGEEEMTEALTGIPKDFQREALVTTNEVADKCKFELPMGDLLMPHYPIPDGFEDMDEYLRHVTFERAKERYGDPLPQKVVDRLNHELGIIADEGYSGYFLIVQDFTDAARELDVRVGPGRGSAAGSCVSYCLEITDVDPIEYDLLFERFLNPERVSMPDIDIDFDDRGRGKVIDYVVEKYGQENVCQIITFGTMGAKTVVRDVSRVLDIPLDRADEIAKMIPEGPGVDLDSAFEENPDFRDLKDADDPEVQKMMQYAEVLEGSVRHTGVHAAGVIIAPGTISDYVPVSVSKSKGEKVITTQYDGDWVEEFGLLKMDFLGLKTLTVIEDTVDLVEETRGIDIDIDDIPLDDEKTFELFQRGDTVSIFQFESTGMREWLRKLKPTEIDDLIAMNALYRPGPMENIPTYIARKHGREEVEYPHPLLEDILEPTYGIAVFQEQVMQMAQKLAGFSLGEADILRRAMGKKKEKLMRKQRKKFVEGCKDENDIEEDEANELFDIINEFAGYGFNKCVTGDTEIIDADSGRPIQVQDIVEGRETDVSVASLDEESQTLVTRDVVDAFSNGEKQTYRLTTRTGRTIRATANHPVYTPDGWTYLGELEEEDRVAVPRSVPYEPSHSMDEHELVVLGYALGTNDLTSASGFEVHVGEEDALQDYLCHLRQFNNTDTQVHRSDSAPSVYAIRNTQYKPSEAVEFIDGLGLKGLSATEKYIPDAAFQLPTSQISVLLGRMWTGDGCIDPDRQQVFYATSSADLAHDVQHLLTRLGLPSTIHEKSFNYRGGTRPGYVVRVSSKAMDRFAETIGPHLVGESQQQLAALLGTDIGNGRMTQDVVPAAVRPLLREEVQATADARDVPMATVMRDAGCSPKLLQKNARKKGYARETVGAVAAETGSDALDEWAHSDLYWDEVDTIEDTGVEEVYDLTVEGTHNFVANDLVVHNSHSAAYSLVAYQTAYLKAHYQPEFMAAAMTNEMSNTDKLSKVLEEARSMDLEVLPPSINDSKAYFTVQDGKIRFGLAAIKNAGEKAIDKIIEARAEHGPFETIYDVTKNVDLSTVNKRTMEALAQAGALDDLEGHRAQLMEGMDTAVRYGQKVQHDRMAGQNSLFGDGDAGAEAMEPGLPSEVERWPKSTRLKEEHEVLGFYVSGHPLDEYRAEADAFATAKFGEPDKLEKVIERAAGGDGRNRGPVRTFCGIITDVSRNTTRSGKPIAFADIEDFTGEGEMVIFSNILDRVQPYLEVDNVVLAKGNVEVRGGTVKVIAKEINPMWKVREQMVSEVVLTVNLDEVRPEALREFKSFCERSPGNCKLYFDVDAPELRGQERLRSRAFVVEPTQEFMKGAQRIFGTKNIALKGK